MKPTLRTIHHLSCTGGTLISKCLASMEGVALLSEVHPFSVGPLRFNPFDPVQQLFSQKLIKPDEDSLKNIFRERIKMAYGLSQLHNMTLILRDHTHSDYLQGRSPSDFRLKSMINTLKSEFDFKSVVTVRNPIDTFLSLKKNNWAGGVKTFDEYCKRLDLMIQAYDGYPFYKYEDFCSDPDLLLKRMCNHLNIEFTPSYKVTFHNKKLTGDSGRGKEIREIRELPHREYSKEYLEEVHSSNYFQKVSGKLGYYPPDTRNTHM